MYTIAMISQKGGTGKTTLALNLAVASEADGKTSVIVDLDPQASAANWQDDRKNESPVVISAQAARVVEVIQMAKECDVEVVILDTSPHSENAALLAARAADLVLIPCRPGILDLRAITSSVDICQLAKVRAVVLLNAIPPRGTLPDEAEEALQAKRIEVCPVRITQRMAFVHSLTDGKTALEFEPDGKAAQEINEVYKWILRQKKEST